MPTLKDLSILIHPGLNGSGPDHWHTHWEQAFPDFVRVQQMDWDHPVYGCILKGPGSIFFSSKTDI